MVSLEIDGTPLIVGEEPRHGSAFEWGLFPMVPFAGRVRGGRFTFRGRDYQLPTRMPPHAIHGVVDDVPWTVASNDDSSVGMYCELSAPWPFRGEVSHRIELRASSLWMELSLTAHESMPAQVGWHPWFVRPATIESSFAEWLPRDEEGMPTQPTIANVPDFTSPVDDCFTFDGSAVCVKVGERRLSLTSDCTHWVVYTEAEHGICVEPQSGPPNEFESAPIVVNAGGVLRRWFEIAW
ncbi:MAG: hypothetical protein RLZZ254_1139 [Actinomycetota bacterium]